MPVKSVLASKCHRLTDIYYKQEKQSEAIYEREQQLGGLAKELANAKGIFKGKQRKEMQEQGAERNALHFMKCGCISMVNMV